MGISRLSILLPLCTDEWVASLYFNDMGFLSGGGTGGGDVGLCGLHRPQRKGNGKGFSIIKNPTPFLRDSHKRSGARK